MLEVVGQYEPAEHWVHGAPPKEYQPGAQAMHALAAWEPGSEPVPTGQARGASATDTQYDPAGQRVQDVAPVRLYEEAGQRRHCSISTAPAMTEKEPAGQGTHPKPDVPFVIRYWPGGHTVQATVPGLAVAL